MFYFLSKTIDFLVMPYSMAFLLILYSLITRDLKRKRKSVVAGLSILFVISNTYLVNRAFLWWEPKSVSISSLEKTYDVGVVLSGGLINVSSLRPDHVELGAQANRFYSAFLLYRAGKIRKILITGTSPKPNMDAGKGEVMQARQILMRWGIPGHDVIIEEKARNTRENAVFSAKIIRDKFSPEKVLLITSAYHMRRSIQCFRKGGIQADYYPCDFYAMRDSQKWKDFIIPSADTVGYFDLLWHEWIGYISYKVIGYC